tara:strand:+ start:111 stop:1010 length:900 start_codon:yes stop_codon:yes gene_type:complete
MKKDQVVILEKRGVILISGEDAKDFLQNTITNDINKVSDTNSIFAALLNPQGKYLFNFFLTKSKVGYLLDCEESSLNDLIENLSKYKLKSRVDIKDLSKDFVVGIISYEKFEDLQVQTDSKTNTINYRDTPIFVDPRNQDLGARILSNLEKLYLTIKKLNLKIVESSEYYFHAYKLGIPEIGTINLKEKLFGLEANFEELNAIDFKKGCFIGQENTARMKLRNKVRKRLLPIDTNKILKAGDEITYKDIKIGNILISGKYPFALIKLINPNFLEFKDKELVCEGNIIKIRNTSSYKKDI